MSRLDKIAFAERRERANRATVRGDGPAYSPYLDAYLVVVGDRLRIADDPEGARLWPTTDEAERAAKEVERAAKEHARARVAELEALLRARGG